MHQKRCNRQAAEERSEPLSLTLKLTCFPLHWLFLTLCIVTLWHYEPLDTLSLCCVITEKYSDPQLCWAVLRVVSGNASRQKETVAFIAENSTITDSVSPNSLEARCLSPEPGDEWDTRHWWLFPHRKRAETSSFSEDQEYPEIPESGQSAVASWSFLQATYWTMATVRLKCWGQSHHYHYHSQSPHLRGKSFLTPPSCNIY